MRLEVIYLWIVHNHCNLSCNYTHLQVSHMYFSQKYNQNPEPHKWSMQTIENLVQRATNLEEFSYGAETQYLYNVFDQYTVKGQHGIVLGTEMPWLEAILLSKGDHAQLSCSDMQSFLIWDRCWTNAFSFIVM